MATAKILSGGDYAWDDVNKNGIQDENEKGLANITVKLFYWDEEVNSWSLIGTTTSSHNGTYKFTEVEAGGQYRLQFVRPEGYAYTQKIGDLANPKNSDADENGFTQSFRVTGDETVLDFIDVGMYKVPPEKLGSIGDRVWLDANQDGIQDSNETGIKNISVQLYDKSGKLLLETRTNDKGQYSFTQLPEGQYKVIFNAPNTYKFTKQDAGSEQKDSDVNEKGEVTIDLKKGEDRSDIDAGLYAPPPPKVTTASIGNLVWDDKNADGLQNIGEIGIANVKVNLLDKDGKVVATTVSDAKGAYLFKDIAQGDYRVQFETPAGYRVSAQNQGKDDSKDSDLDTRGISDLIELRGTNNFNVDAGMYKPVVANIGDKVWLDANGDGLQNPNEKGIEKVTVNLLDADGKTVATTQTDKDGKYLFKDVAPNDYKVQVIAPSDHVFTANNMGKNDQIDSDFNAKGETEAFTLQTGRSNLTKDAGLYKTASIGDKVWNDSNANGIQDNGEAGVANIKVHLYGKDGKLVKETVTDANGQYSFKDLAPGEYKVKFDAPNGFDFTRQNAGKNKQDNLDSDADKDGYIAVKLVSGEINDRIDAGLFEEKNYASVGDKVWKDLNKNGIQDAGEPGMPGVAVNLYGTDGSFHRTVTDAKGNYKFGKLLPGSYSIEFKEPDNYHFSPRDIRNAKGDAGDSDADPSNSSNNGTTKVFTLRNGENNMDIDAGMYYAATAPAPAPVFTPPPAPAIRTSKPFNPPHTTEKSAPIIKPPVVEKTTKMGGQFWQSDAGGADATPLTAGDVAKMKEMGVASYRSPLSIDLNNDGIQTTALENSQGKFDLLGTGKEIKSGWLSPEDGLLALDKNGDGKVNDITELFGGKIGDGFAKLASLDSNHDGVVNAEDTRFTELKVWRDANGDHQTNAGEMLGVTEAGIAGLKVDYIAIPEVDENGNVHLERSSVTMTDGSQRAMNDVYFSVSEQNAKEAGPAAQLVTMTELAAANNNVAHLGPMQELNGHQPNDELHSLAELGLHHVHTEYLEHVEYDAKGHHMHPAADAVPVDLTDAYSNISILDAAHVGASLPVMHEVLTSDHSMEGVLADLGGKPISVHLPYDDTEPTYVSDIANLQKMVHLYEQTAIFIG